MSAGRKFFPLAGFSILLALAVLLNVSASITRSQSQTPPKESRLAEQMLQQDIPTVYYDGRKTRSAKPESETDPARRAKSARYEKRLVVRDIDTGGQPVLRFSHWDAALPALPVARSALVAIVEVVDAKGYLSNDQTGVYSEFTVRVERVFKNDGPSLVFPGDLITTERWGGRVIFPSGRIITYANRGQGMPRLGQHYLFSLSGIPNSTTYSPHINYAPSKSSHWMAEVRRAEKTVSGPVMLTEEKTLLSSCVKLKAAP